MMPRFLALGSWSSVLVARLFQLAYCGDCVATTHKIACILWHSGSSSHYQAGFVLALIFIKMTPTGNTKVVVLVGASYAMPFPSMHIALVTSAPFTE